jgi:hypothetical protein
MASKADTPVKLVDEMIDQAAIDALGKPIDEVQAAMDEMEAEGLVTEETFGIATDGFDIMQEVTDIAEAFFNTLIPEPGVLSIGGNSYPVFFDFISMKDIEKRFKKSVFAWEIKDDDIMAEDFIFLFKIALQGGIRRQLRFDGASFEDMNKAAKRITDDFVMELVYIASDTAATTVNAQVILWTAIKSVWLLGRRVPISDSAKKQEDDAVNPPEKSEILDGKM